MTEVRFTHIGGPTVLIEFAGWRLLTDPTFDPPGRTYSFGWGTSSHKLTGPALPPEDIGPVDAVLLTHDHHGDNLDDTGRALLADVTTVVTTRAGARRLGGTTAQGLKAGQTTRLQAPDRPPIAITATPCRHGPPLSRPVAGQVIGFALTWPGQHHGPLWITGDTVLYGAVRKTAAALRPGTVLIHLGGVQFPLTGPTRYTMTAADALDLCETIQPKTIHPVHYEGWHHFREGPEALTTKMEALPSERSKPFTWLPPGIPHLTAV
ncbi:MBL fold metallo-hydrolase [Streptomyces canus]|uniref:MBL fold metallo-hydrolase n=1 Tax=Streptomyces canus TaxID=58343 RepID=A0A117QWJ3_9ACTN|nr:MULTISPECIES: MBL fold metallo-hydrolase [Streptomyces]KUN58256.1 MBL fold metallo-hydrolase [Streptomyces canus]MDI5911595.1 MBL fold metallo-hydrolase [Streptomyces sp. 12257]